MSYIVLLFNQLVLFCRVTRSAVSRSVTVILHYCLFAVM